jgi:hypothetical protein
LTIQRAASAAAVPSLSATLVNHHVHCRDFRRLPFSEFFNNIGAKEACPINEEARERERELSAQGEHVFGT